jgi:hypothetical protein
VLAEPAGSRQQRENGWADPAQGDSKPVSDGEPGSDSKPVSDGEPGSDSKPVSDSEPGSDSKPVSDSEPGSDSKPVSDSEPVRWLSRRSILLHLTLAVVAPGCLVAAWWQATRALSGNTLSYVYSIEWPVFAGYAVFMWWKILHEPRPAARLEPPGPPRDVASLDEVGGVPKAESGPIGRIEGCQSWDADPDLLAYNRYLASLAARGSRKTWRSATLPTTVRGRDLGNFEEPGLASGSPSGADPGNGS